MKAKKDILVESMRIGTLVNGLQKNPAGYIQQILHHGFESFSLTFSKSVGDTDFKRLAESVNKALDGSGATISSLGIYGNPLEEAEMDLETRKGWEALIDAAHLFGADIVSGFTGRLRGQPIDKSIERFKEVFEPLAKRAADKGIRLAFENCDMRGNWEAGDWNIAHTPAAWELMFQALPDSNVGLEWEPCHQMVKLIDPMPQIRRWCKRIFHIHGKDASVDWDLIRRHGVFGPEKFAFHRTPGFGDSNWTNIISELKRFGYKGAIDIEGWHDPVYNGPLEMTGQVHALKHLKSCRGGTYVENPHD